MKTRQYTLIIAAITALSACAGSNGGGGTDGMAQQPPAPKYQGIAYYQSKAHDITSDNLIKVNIDGKTWTVGNFGISSVGWDEQKTRTYLRLVSGSAYGDMKFGVVIDGNNSADPVAFNQGVATKNMPNLTAPIHYKGESVYVEGKLVYKGNMTLTADLANKTVSGTFKKYAPTGQPAQDIGTFKGQIDNNHYADDDSGTLKVNGRFYGENAESTGGIFHTKDGTIYGAYGAQKQP